MHTVDKDKQAFIGIIAYVDTELLSMTVWTLNLVFYKTKTVEQDDHTAF